MSLNFAIFGQRRSSSSKQSGHLMSADWENHCLSKEHCPSFPEGDCLRVTRMQVGLPCELAKHVDCVLTGNQAGFQESSMVSSLLCTSAVSGKYLCFSAFMCYTDNLGTHTYLAISAEPLFPPVLHLPSWILPVWIFVNIPFWKSSRYYWAQVLSAFREHTSKIFLFQLISCSNENIV